MDSRISSKAIYLIDRALNPLIRSDCQIERIKLMVAAVAAHRTVQTCFGSLQVQPNKLVPQGYAYLIEDTYKGFGWVSRKNKGA